VNQGVSTSPESAHPSETLYVVKEGDTLWDIAARFTGDAHKFPSLARHNGIRDPDVIVPGQVIKIPR
jgi:nucleoid-associated protein YgaU